MLLLVVVAHPDDESFGCGSILADFAAAGHDTAVLCATRGEAGESRIPSDDLASVREAELRRAAHILGVGEVRLLGYRDSGMAGRAEPGTLAAAALPDVAADVRAVVDALRPDVVVTLDASDGHRDHAVVRDATLSAVDTARHRPAATYLWCLARSSMERWADHMRRVGGGDAYLTLGDLGTPDDDITTILDMTSHLPRRLEAIQAHESQLNPYDGLPGDLQRDFLAVDRFRLVRGHNVLAR